MGFPVIRYPHATSNKPEHQITGVIFSQLKRFNLVCTTISGFKEATTSLVMKFLEGGYNATIISKAWSSYILKNKKKYNIISLRLWFRKMIKWCCYNVKESLQFMGQAPNPLAATQVSVSDSAVDRVIYFMNNIPVALPVLIIEDTNPNIVQLLKDFSYIIPASVFPSDILPFLDYFTSKIHTSNIGQVFCAVCSQPFINNSEHHYICGAIKLEYIRSMNL